MQFDSHPAQLQNAKRRDALFSRCAAASVVSSSIAAVLDCAEFWTVLRERHYYSPCSFRTRFHGHLASIPMMADSTAPPNANATARLFPLPNLVLFPQIVQGLHIFEPRYRQLMADTLASDMQFALVLLKPDWENDYDARPPIEAIACLGKVIAHEKMNDGRYNLQLRGMSRIRILEELDDDKLYRTARFEPLSDIVPSQMSELTALRNDVGTAILARFPEGGTTHTQIEELIHSDTPLGPLCDIFAYSLPLPLELKQQLLAECDVAARASQLAAALRLPQPGRRFPPEFSAN